MEFLNTTGKDSIMPTGHKALWRFLQDVLPNEVVCAGSFPSAQMKYNLFGSTFEYTDIDYWCKEISDNPMTKTRMKTVTGV